MASSVGNVTLRRYLDARYEGRQRHPLADGPLSAASADVVQRTNWVWDGQQWFAKPPPADTPYPNVAGQHKGQVLIDKPAVAPFSVAETLGSGTVIDYPALVVVMKDVKLGVEVKSKIWRAMRERLCEAITLPDKKHPVHQNTFDKNQRPEQQIKDWANVIGGEVKPKLAAFFLQTYGIHL